MDSSSSASSSSCNWSYDVFPSFSGEDVRKTFLSHFLKELDGKQINAVKENEIERSRSLGPELKQAIRDSKIAVVVLSKNYASSSWCLNELLEIVKCKKELNQLVIPIFYRLDPSHVRKQTGDFGEMFDKTCQNKTEDEKTRWRGALTDVANILGYHLVTWGANEASMIEEIANDDLGKLHSSPSDEDFEGFVGIEDHIKKMTSMLNLESEEVRMVGIWGPSGIGKTIIARALFSILSRLFQSKVFIDKVFISRSKERADLVDYNMKLHLQRTFLAEILGKKDIKIDNIGAIEKMLKHRRALIVIDDLDDQDVLDAIAGRCQWFGNGSRIIVVTKNKHLLRAHGIDNIYEVCLPSKDLALEMFCRSAFRKKSPPHGFCELASEVVLRAGKLPLGLDVLGSSLLAGTKKVLGIALNIDETDKLDIHEGAFEAMKNLLFLKISTKEWYMKREWNLPELFDYIPPKLRLLSWDNYPRKSLPTNFRPKNLVKIQMQESKLEKLWDGAHSLTALKNMDLRGSKSLKEIPDLSKATSLETLNLSYCSSLVELPSSIQYLNKLSELDMSFCESLETLPTGINLKSLHNVNLDGCILLKSFPDISTNISELNLNQTAIEEVPWWIENFSSLGSLYMYGCNSLLRVSLNMTKLKHLHQAEFSDCGALSESSWNASSSDVAMSTDDIQPKFIEDNPDCPPEGYFSMLNLSFIGCSNFDPEALINQQSAFMELMLLGEEVPSYFTHRTTGTSLTNIPLPHISPSQPVFSFRCCAVVEATGPLSFEIENGFRFIDSLGNHVESVDLVRSFTTTKLGSYQVIFDCYFPLTEEIVALVDQLKDGHMDIQFRFVNEDPQLQLKGCGIQFPDRER